MTDDPSAPAAPNDETLVYRGGDVKALGDGVIGGTLAPFASPDAPDPQGDWFHPGTDFGLDVTDRARLVVDHGFTKAFGPRKFGVTEMFVGPTGLEGRTRLDLSDPAAKSYYGKAERGQLFYSSGSAERLVVRTPVGGTSRIDAWPVLEVSMTERPVDRRARAFALKSLFDSEPGAAVAAPSLLARSESLVAEVEEVVRLFDKAVKSRLSEHRSLSPEKRDAIKALAGRLESLWRASRPGPDPAAVRSMRLALLRHSLTEIGTES